MQKFESIYLPRMRNDEHFQFMTDVDELITTCQISELGIARLYTAFKTTLMAEDAALRIELGSLASKKTEELDVLRNKTWKAISMRVDATLLSPIEDEANSARVLRRLIDLYGDVRSKSYNEESMSISNLLKDFDLPENLNHINKIGLSAWIGELKNQNDQFHAFFNERNAELTARDSGNLKSIRLQIDPIYEDIIEKINAAIVMEVAKPIAFAFMSELNERIKYYKNTLRQYTSPNKEEKPEVKV